MTSKLAPLFRIQARYNHYFEGKTLADIVFAGFLMVQKLRYRAIFQAKDIQSGSMFLQAPSWFAASWTLSLIINFLPRPSIGPCAIPNEMGFRPTLSITISHFMVLLFGAILIPYHLPLPFIASKSN